MNDSIIRVENLGKKYTLGFKKESSQYTTLRDIVSDRVKGLTNLTNRTKQSNEEDSAFWALKDVSFEIKQGDRVGVVGRNGAGKSTLLKVLSRITEPTNGRVRIKGRVASLLEVGTGFHPELTGRENIYLNGAILGMSKVEIHRKFDEIVAFAEVEKFLDTPVKRYSSGMYVRLAFSVAAHLEPEILIVDEVLAVGDVKFQKKCLGKMEEVGREGRTVIFVSHNTAAIRTLCTTGILLRKGELVLQDSIGTVVDEYMSEGLARTAEAKVIFSQPSDAPMWIESATVMCNGLASNNFYTSDSISVQLSYSALQPINEPKVGWVLYSSDGSALLNANNHYQKNLKSLAEPSSTGIVTCNLGAVPLTQGKYFISLWLGDSIQNHHYVEHALSITVTDADVWGTAKVPPHISPLWWPTKFSVQQHETHFVLASKNL